MIKERTDDLDNKRGELNDILSESQEEEKKLLGDREKATKKIENKLLKASIAPMFILVSAGMGYLILATIVINKVVWTKLFQPNKTWS